MRSHAKIIKDVGGISLLRQKLAAVGVSVDDPTVRSWQRRPDAEGSIPAAYWAAFVSANITTLPELAAAAAARRFPDRGAGRPAEAQAQ